MAVLPPERFLDPEDPCQSLSCTRIDGKCVGWHCARCGAPCSSQGHACPPEREAD